MRELLGRLSALDHGAESAVRVIAYFDALIDGHAGLDALVRGAAVLSGCPAGLHDAARHLAIRIDPEGHRLEPADGTARPGWPTAALDEAGARVWLERGGGAQRGGDPSGGDPSGGSSAELDAMIVERFAAGARVVLDRTRGRTELRDPALVEVLVDPNADADARARAARRLGLAAGSTARVIASRPVETDAGGSVRAPAKRPVEVDAGGSLRATAKRPVEADAGGGLRASAKRPVEVDAGGAGRVEVDGGALPAVLRRRHTVVGQVDVSVVPHAADWTGDPDLVRRVGIGPSVVVEELPRSWEGALVALRLTADGTALDPGPRQLRHDELGGLALLAATVPAAAARIPDVVALEALGHQLPWALATLDAIAEHASLRRAAASLHVHHSTLQERGAQLARLLGYPLDTAAGHNRLYLALVLRRLHRNGDLR